MTINQPNYTGLLTSWLWKDVILHISNHGFFPSSVQYLQLWNWKITLWELLFSNREEQTNRCSAVNQASAASHLLLAHSHLPSRLTSLVFSMGAGQYNHALSAHFQSGRYKWMTMLQKWAWNYPDLRAINAGNSSRGHPHLQEAKRQWVFLVMG